MVAVREPTNGEEVGGIGKRPRLPRIYLKQCQSVHSIPVGKEFAIRGNCVANNRILWRIGRELPLHWIASHFRAFPSGRDKEDSRKDEDKDGSARDDQPLRDALRG